MAQTESPLFSKTFDFLEWLLKVSNHFPRAYRQSLTARLLNSVFDFREAIENPNNNRGQGRFAALSRADEKLQLVRVYFRLTYKLQWINLGQYEHGAKMVHEMGRLLGGWKKISQINTK
ncbi:MAG: hypothetical protein ACI8P9_000822 [Parasphingorhabdus sp.]|jgi:hypothetical protein